MAEPASEAAFTGSQPSSPALFSHPKQLPVFKWNLNDENTLGFLALKQRRFESIQDCGAFKKLFFLICRWDSVEAWLVDFFTVARQGHKPRFQTPTWARAFSCVVEAGVPPPEGVFKRMRTKDILVSSKVWTWSLHLYWKIYHLRNTHWFHHMGGVAQIVFSSEEDQDLFNLKCRHTVWTNPALLFHTHGIYQDVYTSVIQKRVCKMPQ